MSFIVKMVVGGAMLAVTSSARAQNPPLSGDAAVEAQIRKGAAALLSRVQVTSTVRYRMHKGKESYPVDFHGRVVERAPRHLKLRGKDGRELEIPYDDIIRTEDSAALVCDLPPPNNGGPLALFAFALLSARTDMQEPELRALLRTLEQHPMPGTYGRGLRAAVWARRGQMTADPIERAKYRRLLSDDVGWIVRSMKEGGWYSYDRPGDHVDNSVTQFANLGVWAGAGVLAEVPAEYWGNVERHWLSTQRPDGGWTYSTRDGSSKPSMTIAGANSLYIVLDDRYTRMERPYIRFRGATVADKVRTERARVYDAILHADDYLRQNNPGPGEFGGYNLFGLERLGVASGRALIGGRDWYREGAESLLDRKWGNDAFGDCFALIFLSHGRSPVWIQKLDYSANPEVSNRYGRDLNFLTQYISRTFEKPYRWQIVPANADLATLRSAPILYMAGKRAPAIAPDMQAKIREFLDGGGALFLHADLAGTTFTSGCVHTFEQLYRDRGYHFQPLPENHPVYTCYFGRRGSPWTDRPPLLGMSDGKRDFILLCPVDIAGAWQQNLIRKQSDLFQLMANVREYLAPAYEKLPPRLRSSPVQSAEATE